MMEDLARKAGDSIWRKVGEKALITAVETFLSETIKASVEVVKKAKLRAQQAAFDDKRARVKKASEAAAEAEEVDAADDQDEDEEAGAADSDAESGRDSGEEPGGPTVDFAAYVARRRP